MKLFRSSLLLFRLILPLLCIPASIKPASDASANPSPKKTIKFSLSNAADGILQENPQHNPRYNPRSPGRPTTAGYMRQSPPPLAIQINLCDNSPRPETPSPAQQHIASFSIPSRLSPHNSLSPISPNNRLSPLLKSFKFRKKSSTNSPQARNMLAIDESEQEAWGDQYESYSPQVKNEYRRMTNLFAQSQEFSIGKNLPSPEAALAKAIIHAPQSNFQAKTKLLSELDQQTKNFIFNLYSMHRKDNSERDRRDTNNPAAQVKKLVQQGADDALHTFIANDLYALSMTEKPFLPQEIAFIRGLCENVISPTKNIAPEGAEKITFLRSAHDSDNARADIDHAQQPGKKLSTKDPRFYILGSLLAIAQEEALAKRKLLKARFS